MSEATLENCPEDANNKHCWTSIGVIVKDGITYQIHKCSQCGYCKPEQLMFVSTII